VRAVSNQFNFKDCNGAEWSGMFVHYLHFAPRRSQISVLCSQSLSKSLDKSQLAKLFVLST